MNILLWVLQVLLAAQFLMHGWIFTFPPTEMAGMMDEVYAPWFRIFIGVAELFAAVGLVLPGLTRILPWLTPLAAAGLTIVMASATGFHLIRGEMANALYTAVLLILVTFVAYMRWKVRPIAPSGAAQSTREARPAEDLSN